MRATNKMKKPTMSEIRQHNMEAGFHTFDRKTLKFFGETMRDYRVGKALEDGTVEVYRSGGRAGSATFIYNPKTGEVRKAGN